MCFSLNKIPNFTPNYAKSKFEHFEILFSDKFGPHNGVVVVVVFLVVTIFIFIVQILTFINIFKFVTFSNFKFIMFFVDEFSPNENLRNPSFLGE